MKCADDMNCAISYSHSPRPKRNSLFLVDLLLDKEGSHFSTNLTSFEPALVGLFDRGIGATQNVPQLEKVIGFITWCVDFNNALMSSHYHRHIGGQLPLLCTH